ncbi:hypothetical protein BDV25DRAFT_168782 [Aspergillus avenaceus]|uniref:G-patch domain-containing protein n=1 Tax=Aspergillus avenaceus TaxID=36643 RepID=A0A5N6TNR2_ASPAV|nr:hypothetical protein BDV25DRAFT_168782 [Aspergillus avenaceus]
MPKAEEGEEDYFLPPQDQRPFGAGIRRKPVPFVRSNDLTTTPTTRTSSAPPSTSIANKYLSIVLPKEATSESTQSESTQLASTGNTPNTGSTTPSQETSSSVKCEVCNLPMEVATGPHEASLAHQVCLAHSHPPSHLDRTRPGLRYLAAYGWDPDSRLGVGVPGREGIREPLKGRLKVDTIGLGAGKDEEEGRDKKKKVVRAEKVQKLNAKEVRRNHAEARKRGDHLRQLFYQSDDVLKYLGQ